MFGTEFAYARVGHIEYGPGPSNKTTGEGSMGILIHCPFPAPIWSINSVLHEPLSLHPPFEIAHASQGINISLVEIAYNNTKFQCFSSDGPELKVKKSEVGTLTVTMTGIVNIIIYYNIINSVIIDYPLLLQSDGYHPPKMRPKAELVLDHRRFNFGPTNTTIAWKFNNNQSCSSFLIYTIKSSRCEANSPTANWTTRDLELVLPSSAFVYLGGNNLSNLVCFVISAVDEYQGNCSGTSIHFQVQPNGTFSTT